MDNTKALEGLTYVCTDALLLEDINKKLEAVMANMQNTLSAADGFACNKGKNETKLRSELPEDIHHYHSTTSQCCFSSRISWPLSS